MAQRYYAAWLLLSLLVACAGIAKPETFRQQVAYVEGGLTSAYQTIGQFKVSGRIDAQQRDNLIAKADTVGTALDATHAALAVGNDVQASNSLSLARAALVALQQVLKEMEQ